MLVHLGCFFPSSFYFERRLLWYVRRAGTTFVAGSAAEVAGWLSSISINEARRWMIMHAALAVNAGLDGLHAVLSTSLERPRR